jgi:hypothetical protein
VLLMRVTYPQANSKWNANVEDGKQLEGNPIHVSLLQTVRCDVVPVQKQAGASERRGEGC